MTMVFIPRPRGTPRQSPSRRSASRTPGRVPHPATPLSGHPHVAPAARSDHAQLDPVEVGLGESLDEAYEVLARLERRDGEDEIALARRALRMKRVVDPVPNEANLLV